MSKAVSQECYGTYKQQLPLQAVLERIIPHFRANTHSDFLICLYCPLSTKRPLNTCLTKKKKKNY